MIDIHHHLLWGLDDGATSVETSVAMARIAADEGITHIVCSPHANGTYAYEPRVIAEKIAEL
jgi:protein-tyrosine phosphatase